MKLSTTLAVAALTFLSLAADSALAQATSDDRAFMEKFGVIIQRNIFARNRAQASQRPSTTRTEPPPRPEQFLILTGTVRLEDSNAFIAFIEDTRSGTTSKVQAGSTVAQGKVTRIDFGILEYEVEGKQILVEIGKSLAGSSSVPKASTTQPADGAASADSADRTSGGSAPSGDLAERMRQRRMQELKK